MMSKPVNADFDNMNTYRLFFIYLNLTYGADFYPPLLASNIVGKYKLIFTGFSMLSITKSLST